MLFLSNLVATLLLPLGLALLIGFAALTLSRTQSRIVVLGTLAFLCLASMPWTANQLALWWEAPYPPLTASESPAAPVAILLGGVTSGSAYAGHPPMTGQSVDRVFHAARLFHAGRVTHLLASGGALPWREGRGAEADRLATLLVELGVPRSAILVETSSRNTRENAVNAAAVLEDKGWTDALLVTSAWHMRRAEQVFAVAGIQVTAAATDHIGDPGLPMTVLAFLPTAGALFDTSRIVSEMMGRAYYRLQGWV